LGSDKDYLARILIVDDDSTFRRTLRLSLRSLGHETTDAGSGDEAMQFAKAAAPDVAVVDWQMPGMDGLQTCNALHGRFGVPVIMISANQANSKSSAFAAGASDFLNKPFALEDLLMSITTILQR